MQGTSKDVEKLLDQFKSLEGITKNSVHQWAWDSLEKKTLSVQPIIFEGNGKT